MNVEQRNYIEATKMLLPHLETIKKEHDLEKRKVFAKTAVMETLDIKKVDENSELFQQILERVEAIYKQAKNPVDEQVYEKILEKFDTYDLDNISDPNLKAIMKASRDKNAGKFKDPNIVLSLLSSVELKNIQTLPTTPLIQVEKIPKDILNSTVYKVRDIRDIRNRSKKILRRYIGGRKSKKIKYKKSKKHHKRKSRNKRR